MSGRYDRPLTPEQIAAVKDGSIDFSDIPELDEEFWERAELVEPDRTDQITMACQTRRAGLFQGSGEGLSDANEPRTRSYVRHRTRESAGTGEDASH